MRMNLFDNTQEALNFLVSQVSTIESEVYRTQYPDIQYSQLIPVDTSGNEWTKSITFFSMDKMGAAAWFNHMGTTMPMADFTKQKFEQGIEMAAIGYRYTLEEVGQAMMVPGLNLTNERADAARFAYETFVDKVALQGSADKGWTGLFNNADVTRVDAAEGAVGANTAAKRLWSNKTADEMILDVNDALTGVYTGTNTVEMADTVLLPHSALLRLSTVRIENTSDNGLSYLAKYNIYTLTTGKPLTIRGVLGLETAGDGGLGRMIAYKRDPRILKMHIPMPHRFLPIWQTGPLIFDIPGIFRLGGVEIRRPGAMRYVDGITPVPA